MGSDRSAHAEPTLRLLPVSIAESIRRATDVDALQRFASACARCAMEACEMEEPLLRDALLAAATLDAQAHDQIARLRQRVSERVHLLDERALEMQEGWDRGESSYSAYKSAFRAARAATSVLHALEQPAALAAAEACYEAFHALDQPQATETLLEIAQHELDM